MNTPDVPAADRDHPMVPPTSAMTFGLRSTSKIRDLHLNRLAMVYVRQSSPQQVLENRESRERQYALAQFAERLGWPAERVVIIDEDQGQSGKTADNRSGFQRLMTEVSLNHVGMVLGLELSRLSRSNKDWHQLIDVCGIFNTLLCDQDAIYDSLDSNDRLLLGLRGAMSEYELVTLRNRLLRGSRNKAERGELFLHVPVGYLKTSTGEIIQEPDEQARGMVRLVFDKFEDLGSAYAVFRYFLANQFQLGFRPQSAARNGELEWRPPTPNGILGILRHPIYAGAYAYGLHRPGTKNPATGRTKGGTWFVPPEEIPVLLRDRLPAYISWDRYLANQQRLKQNRSLPDTPGRRSVAPLCCKVWSCAASAVIACRRATRPAGGRVISATSTGGRICRRVAVTSRHRRWTTWSSRNYCVPWNRPSWNSACVPSRTSSRSGSVCTITGVRSSNACSTKSAGPSDNIRSSSLRIAWWREPWRRVGRTP